MNIENTDILFDIAEKRKLKYVTIQDKDIVKLGKSLDALGRKIRNDYWEESYVRMVFNTVRNYYFSFSTSVQYFNQMLDVDLNDLRIKYRELKVSYPELYPEFLTVAQLIKSIKERDDNPLVLKVKKLIGKQGESRVVIVTRRMPLNEELSNFYEIIGTGKDNVEFMGEGAFRKTQFVFDTVLFIGSEFFFNHSPIMFLKEKQQLFYRIVHLVTILKKKVFSKGLVVYIPHYIQELLISYKKYQSLKKI